MTSPVCVRANAVIGRSRNRFDRWRIADLLWVKTVPIPVIVRALAKTGDRYENQCTQSPQGHHHRGDQGRNTAHVRLDVGGSEVTASITNEAVDELELVAGKTAYAIVKASDVMVAID